MQLKVKNILPKNWKYKEHNDLIKIWYENPKGRSPSAVTIKKKITINEKSGIFLGFWAGDGGKIQFSLANNNTKLLKIVLKNMKESLGEIDVDLRIMVPLNFIPLKKEIIQDIKTNFLDIKKIKVNNYNKTRKQPIYQIVNNKTVFVKFVKHLHNYISENINKKDSFWDGYLKGIIAAEGHMEIRKQYNTLSRISIAQENQNIRKNIFESLEARNIKFYFDKRSIRISGKENYNIILKRNLYKLHPVKKNQFLLGYKNIKQDQYSHKEAEFKILNELKKPSRVSEVAKRLKRERQTIREHMQLKSNSLFERGLIKKNGEERGLRGSFYGELWTLTGKGLNYLEEGGFR